MSVVTRRDALTKLIYVTQAEIPSRRASSVHAMLQCEGFAQLGLKTCLLGQRSRTLPHVEDCHAFYAIEPTFGLELRPRVRRLPLAFAHRARRFLRAHGADVLYGRDLPAIAWAARVGTPAIFESHSPLRRPIEQLLFRSLLRQPNVRRVVVISERLKEIMLGDYSPHLREEQVLVAHDGVDLDRMKTVSSTAAGTILRRGQGSFVAGYFGHLYPGRGIGVLLRAAAALPNMTFLIVGGDPNDVARLRERTIKLANVIVAGFRPRSELPPYWAACDALLMPYQERVGLSDGGNTAVWMSPMKMFEYMALEKPIISSDLPVLREILANERNALLVSPDAPEAWISALSRLREDAALRNRLTAQARRDVAAYSWLERARRVVGDIVPSPEVRGA